MVEIFPTLESVILPGAWLDRGSWLTIGSFDGVHLGHQTLIRRLVKTAHEQQAPALVLTFWPHPVVVLRGLNGPFFLTDPEERASLLGKLGVDRVITLAFTHDLAGLSAFDFMQMLKESLGLAHLTVGYDFALGRGREGNLARLEEIGQQLKYTVEAVAAKSVDGKVVSSSGLRSYLAEGAVDRVAQGLGRYYQIAGEVVHGDGRGHGLGIPTANLTIPPGRLLPAVGVYAGWARVGDQRLKAVTNIGYRPTFEPQAVEARVETHLIDFDQDLYGRTVQLEFVTRLRGEQRFASISALLAQIEADIQAAREVLKGDPSDETRTPDLPVKS